MLILEDRITLSGVSLFEDTIKITGTPKADVVIIWYTSQKLNISFNGKISFLCPEYVKTIDIKLKGGNDTLYQNTDIDTIAHMGKGRDLVQTLAGGVYRMGKGRDTVYADGADIPIYLDSIFSNIIERRETDIRILDVKGGKGYDTLSIWDARVNAFGFEKVHSI